ncbi:MAG TPA: 4-hydroxythreonine-4-phosphate dehydrogenase PdxA [Longimicrobiales bacterium]|nr:4-hydroxythreonine-4-phosphate dehydrogenase PdxA [Longimicrobiales bacterium]
MPSAGPASPRIRLAITLGDPRGIGPEIAAAAARSGRPANVELVFVGPAHTAADGAGDELVELGSWRGDEGAAAAGRIAGLAIERAVELARAGRVDAIVTAPIDKAALYAAGYHYPGHTEMLAALAGGAEVVMLMAAEHTALGGALRVVLATTHLPLAEVPARFTRELLVRQTRLTAAGLRDGFGIARPRIALCAFNPHASDGGRFGHEEESIYGPAMTQLRSEDIDVTGPIPADTVFLRAARGEFDVVIAPYHDVGMAAFKTVAFGRGVNITLGLPFVRTSPDHGTALDIAGRGLADASSMREALALAAALVRRRHALVS